MKTAIFSLILFITACNTTSKQQADAGIQVKNASLTEGDTLKRVVKTDDEWRKQLGDFVYHVVREKGTERAFTGEYWDHHDDGIYVCIACDLPLFDSKTKFESGTGWPSFFQPIKRSHVAEKSDFSYMMKRTEVLCARCDGHLGHVFDDGPNPTGLRYCMNSASLRFVKRVK